MTKRLIGLLLATALIGAAPPAGVSVGDRILPPPAVPAKSLMPFVKLAAPTIALTHVRVIDGTGASPLTDRTVIIRSGKIAAILDLKGKIPDGATVLDMTGRSLLPGIVGMHDHMYYIARPGMDDDGHADVPSPLVPQMTFSAPRMYLANGVTTIRTTGSVEPYTGT